MAFAMKYFPHYDDIARRACGRDAGAAIRLTTSRRTFTIHVPHLATVLQWTGASPWMDLAARLYGKRVSPTPM